MRSSRNVRALILLAIHGVYAFVMKTPEEIMIERVAREAHPVAS